MRLVSHSIRCSHGPDTCQSTIGMSITGAHELRSVSQMLEDVAALAGWQFYAGRQWCPEHGTSPRRSCFCSQRHGIKHDATCDLSKPVQP